jgi:hypothetical protein
LTYVCNQDTINHLINEIERIKFAAVAAGCAGNDTAVAQLDELKHEKELLLETALAISRIKP